MVHCRFFWHYHHCSLSFSTKSTCLYSSQNLFKSDLQIRSNMSTSVSQVTKAMEISLSIQFKRCSDQTLSSICASLPVRVTKQLTELSAPGPKLGGEVAWCFFLGPATSILHPGKRSISTIFIISRHGLNAMDLNKEEGQGSWRFVRLKPKTQKLFNLRTWLTLSFSGTS